MMEFTAILKGSQVMAQFLGLDSVAAFWYLSLCFGGFTWLFKRQAKISKDNSELLSMKAALTEKVESLKEKQQMQKNYVKEQEIRYTDILNRYIEIHGMYHEIKDKE